MFWLAKEFGQPVYAWSERRVTGNHPTIFHVIWAARIVDWLKGNANGAPSLDRYLPLDAFFHGVNVATFRSDWDDSNAFYLAFKGGTTRRTIAIWTWARSFSTHLASAGRSISDQIIMICRSISVSSVPPIIGLGRRLITL
jgi:hypothetical protein